MSVPSRRSVLSRRLSCAGPIFCLAVWALLCLPITRAAAYTPESPEVQAMIKRGLVFLESKEGDEERLGGKCLVGMVFNMAGYEEDHPRIREAVEACNEACKGKLEDIQHPVMYSVAIGLAFLIELNPVHYREQIDILFQWLIESQKADGAWGYVLGGRTRTGDPSVTQYAVLSLWLLERSGIELSLESRQSLKKSVKDAFDWLARTQFPNGAWAYPEKSGPAVRPSMVAAGLGTTYLCADLLGVTKQLKNDPSTSGLGFELPPAFKHVEVGEKRNRISIDKKGIAGRIRKTIGDAEEWFENRGDLYKAPGRYPIFYMYAFERYQDVREAAEDRSESSPKWYNEGVEWLRDQQEASGAWLDSGRPVGTSLAILFLMRSTRKSTHKVNYGDGLLRGGRGLPKDIANARVQRGRIVSEPLGGKAEDILSVLEDPDDPKFEALIDNPGAITLSEESTSKSNQIERFRRLIRGGNPAARRLAVRTLTGRRELDNVPILIYALSDADNQVAVEARDALRFISRKFNGVDNDMPDQPDRQNKIAATSAWKKWYRSIRPDAEFLK